jgi:hypothetical protein
MDPPRPAHTAQAVPPATGEKRPAVHAAQLLVPGAAAM